MQLVTIFKQFTKVVEHQTLASIIKSIRSGVYKEKIQTIRQLIHQDRKEEAQQKKKQLLAFTVSGKFGGGRKLEHLQEYHPFIVLDVDHLPDSETTRQLQEQARELPYTYASFISPSGVGVKIIIKVDTDKEQHQLAYEQVANYYEDELGIKVDRSGKDINRLCYVSYDPGAYINEEASQFKVDFEFSNPPITIKLQECQGKTSASTTYQPGNRNNYIYQFAANCNRAGVPIEATQNYCQQQFDLPNQEMISTIRSAYTPPSMQFNQGVADQIIESPPIEEELLNTLCLPDELFNHLPKFLKESCAVFTGKRERDVFLTSALAILSGCMSHISGLYHGQRTYPNLYTLILAPAASGKSAMNYARMLAQSYHDKMIEKSIKEKKSFQLAQREYQKDLNQKNPKEEHHKPPEQPVFKTLFIPANSSSSRIIKHLRESEGQAIICETEADTLGNVLKQDWGGYSDLLRKAFSGETISQSRRTDDEYTSIKNARLSVALTGTPKQLLRLIPSPEDGLFSRFLFYTFNAEPIWQDVSPQSQKTDVYRHFEEKADETLQMIYFWEKQQTTFELQSHQWHYLNQYFQQELTKANVLYGPSAESTIKRGGNILFRMAMVLSACRQYETNYTADQYICQESEFQTAFQMIDTYVSHALFLLEKLPKPRGKQFNPIPNTKRAFVEALPAEFKRSEAISLGTEYNLKPRTIDRLLKKLLGVTLEQRDYGVYRKIKGKKSSLTPGD